MHEARSNLTTVMLMHGLEAQHSNMSKYGGGASCFKTLGAPNMSYQQLA
jgi:hypothetical protein